MFGADYAKGPMVMGLSLAHSRGLGGYDGLAAGRVASSVTGLYPWLGYQVSERVSVWGVSGCGAGGLLLMSEGGSMLEGDLSMKMAAAGTRGQSGRRRRGRLRARVQGGRLVGSALLSRGWTARRGGWRRRPPP